jgi:hypothetical protein
MINNKKGENGSQVFPFWFLCAKIEKSFNLSIEISESSS